MVLVSIYNTQDPELLLNGKTPLWLVPRDPDQLPPKKVEVSKARRVEAGVLLKVKGHHDRKTAQLLKGFQLCVERSILPPTEEDEYYLADLLNLEALTTTGLKLGRVEKLMENKAGGWILVIVDEDREFLVPFTDEYVPAVNLQAKTIEVEPVPGLLD
jgi:16S rRNA processing protein RimM